MVLPSTSMGTTPRFASESVGSPYSGPFLSSNESVAIFSSPNYFVGERSTSRLKEELGKNSHQLYSYYNNQESFQTDLASASNDVSSLLGPFERVKLDDGRDSGPFMFTSGIPPSNLHYPLGMPPNYYGMFGSPIQGMSEGLVYDNYYSPSHFSQFSNERGMPSIIQNSPSLLPVVYDPNSSLFPAHEFKPLENYASQFPPTHDSREESGLSSEIVGLQPVTYKESLPLPSSEKEPFPLLSSLSSSCLETPFIPEFRSTTFPSTHSKSMLSRNPIWKSRPRSSTTPTTSNSNVTSSLTPVKPQSLPVPPAHSEPPRESSPEAGKVWRVKNRR